MSIGIEIRPATIDDAPLVLEFTRKLAEYEERLHLVRSTAEDMARALAAGKIEAAFAFHADEPVGFIVYYEKFSTFRGAGKLYLEDIYVDASMQGRGVGGALMRFFARRAVERGCVGLEWQVLTWNESAMAFYRRLGAEPFHDWENWSMSAEAVERLAEADGV